jgi:phage anti-repressor protein
MSKLTLKDFLKKYSTLSNEFIDDFYKIYDFNNYDNNNFIINLEIISKWLNSEKGKLKKTLINSYNQDIDYKISKEKEGKISKSNKEIILLTPDCFKRLCLLSRTKKAEQVRTYYLELEKLINNYKNYIIEALQNTVNILENNQKEVSSNIKATVYILQSQKDIDGIYRFGQTEDFKKRLQNYNSANSDKMKVILIYETKNAIKIEKCVIAQIKELRYKKRKDFYEMDLKLLKNIIKDCDELTLKYKKNIKNTNQNIKNTNQDIKINNQDGGKESDKLYLYIKK